MGDPLAVTSDVEDLWRPLSSAETTRVANLISKASALLRQRMPAVDARIARFKANPTDPAGLDPDAVANVVATVVKRFLVNPDGATNVSETSGPYSESKGFALRGDVDIRGELIILASDVEALAVSSISRPRLGTVRTGATLAPRHNGAATEASVAAAGYGPLDDGWITRDPGY